MDLIVSYHSPFITAISQSFCDIFILLHFIWQNFIIKQFFLTYFVFTFFLFFYAFIACLFCVLQNGIKPIFILLDNSSPTLLYFALFWIDFYLAFSFFCSSGLDLFLSGFHYFIPYFAAEYSQVTCLRGKFSSSVFLKIKRLSYFTVSQGLKLQVQSDFLSEFGEAAQLCSVISLANGRSHVVVDSVGFSVS